MTTISLRSTASLAPAPRSHAVAVIAPISGDAPTPRTRLLKTRASDAEGARRARMPGDVQATTAIDDVAVRALVADARRWVARYGGSSADIDDVVQDAMLEVFNALDRFRGQASLRSYAYCIVMRTAARRCAARRVLRNRYELVGDVEASTEDDPERTLALRSLMSRVDAALANLSDHARRAFVLCAVERLSHDEAAELEGVPLETLRARLKRARAALVVALADDPDLSRN